MIKIKYPIALMLTFVWIGFVCAISFMEAWLKFRPPGITVALGLGIGKIVFQALNRMEWIFSVLILIDFLRFRKWTQFRQIWPLVFPVFLLIIQTFWLLPVLDERADMHIQNLTVPPSNHHYYFIVIEIIKVVSLIVFGISLLKKLDKSN
jgi:hypothetical protein